MSNYLNKGSTRITWLFGKWAIKIPNIFNWECFLKGILANLKEAKFGRYQFKYLAPVLWCSWGGFVIVMPRVEVCHYSNKYLSQWSKQLKSLHHYEKMMYENIVEYKFDSVGLYKGNIVAVDYGS